MRTHLQFFAEAIVKYCNPSWTIEGQSMFHALKNETSCKGYPVMQFSQGFEEWERNDEYYFANKSLYHKA